MSRDASVTLPCGDQDRTFRLAIGQIRKVEEKCDAGLPELIARMAPPIEAMRRGVSYDQAARGGLGGSFRADDVREPIFQGLIGGGMSPTEAGLLVCDIVDGRPLWEALLIAYPVLYAALVGAPDEPLGEPKGAAAGESPRSQDGEPGSPASTARAPRSGSRRRKSTK